MLTAKDVKEAALRMGADICGIGAMSRFEGAPKGYDPRYLFPEAKSAVGLAFRVHRGLYRPMEEGTHWGMYSSLGYANINDVHMPLVLRQLGSFIEDHGYEAVLYNNTAVRYNANQGVPVRDGYPAPSIFLHFRIAGVICGMGEIGWSNIFLTSRFGPRQRLAFIFTDAELEPDPLVKPHLCDRCMLCVKRCPAKAISAAESVSFTVEGTKYEYARLDEERCWVGFQCGSEETNPFVWGDNPDAELVRWLMKSVYNDDTPRLRQRQIHSRWAAFNVIYEKHAPSASGMYNFRHPGCMCGATCQRECMIHLEEQNKLENKFHTKFRIRKPWRLDAQKLAEKLYGPPEKVSDRGGTPDKLVDYSGE